MLRRKSKIVVGPALIIFPNLILPASSRCRLARRTLRPR